MDSKPVGEGDGAKAESVIPIPDEIKKAMEECPTLALKAALLKGWAIGLDNPSPTPEPAVSQDEAMDEQVMRERDDYEDRLTNLANAVGSYFDVPVGEWSNCNEPDRVALGILNGEYKTKFDALSPPAEPVELPLLGSPWRSDLRTNIPEQQRYQGRSRG